MLGGLLLMGGLGVLCGIGLALASKIFYVYVDPKVEAVADAFAGANCGGCGFSGCSAAAAAVVPGKAKPNACVVGGLESAQKAAAIMGVEVGSAEVPKSQNPCTGGLQIMSEVRAAVRRPTGMYFSVTSEATRSVAHAGP